MHASHLHFGAWSKQTWPGKPAHGGVQLLYGNPEAAVSGAGACAGGPLVGGHGVAGCGGYAGGGRGLPCRRRGGPLGALPQRGIVVPRVRRRKRRHVRRQHCGRQG